MRVRSIAVLAVLVLIASSSSSWAQLESGGRSALENSRGGPVAGRSPGNMVQAGVAQANMFGRGTDIGFDVTETSEPTSPRNEFFAQAIEEIFADLVAALEQLHNLILLRAGRTVDPSFLAGLLSQTERGE